MEERKESFDEYRIRIKGAGTKNNHPFEIRNSWGVYDYYKAYRHQQFAARKKHLNQKEYFRLIRLVNSMLMDKFIEDKRLKLPYDMGEILALGYNHSLKIVDGKVKTSRGVDWDKTLRLWYEDAEAEKNKTLIRREYVVGMDVQYRKLHAHYKNKSFYRFKMHREKLELLRRSVKNSSFELPYFVDTTAISIKALYNG